MRSRRGARSEFRFLKPEWKKGGPDRARHFAEFPGRQSFIVTMPRE